MEQTTLTSGTVQFAQDFSYTVTFYCSSDVPSRCHGNIWNESGELMGFYECMLYCGEAFDTVPTFFFKYTCKQSDSPVLFCFYAQDMATQNINL